MHNNVSHTLCIFIIYKRPFLFRFWSDERSGLTFQSYKKKNSVQFQHQETISHHLKWKWQSVDKFCKVKHWSCLQRICFETLGIKPRYKIFKGEDDTIVWNELAEYLNKTKCTPSAISIHVVKSTWQNDWTYQMCKFSKCFLFDFLFVITWIFMSGSFKISGLWLGHFVNMHWSIVCPQKRISTWRSMRQNGIFVEEKKT